MSADPPVSPALSHSSNYLSANEMDSDHEHGQEDASKPALDSDRIDAIDLEAEPAAVEDVNEEHLGSNQDEPASTGSISRASSVASLSTVHSCSSVSSKMSEGSTTCSTSSPTRVR